MSGCATLGHLSPFILPAICDICLVRRGENLGWEEDADFFPPPKRDLKKSEREFPAMPWIELKN